MVFKSWLTDLAKIQGVVNNIEPLNIVSYIDTGLLVPDLAKNLSASINGLNLQQAQLALSTKKLTQEQMKQVLVEAGLIASEDKIQAGLVQTALAQANLSKETQNSILGKLGLMNMETNELFISKSCTKEKLLETLATKGVTGANAEAIISSLGLSTANSGLAVSFKVLSASIKEMLLLNPMAWIMIGISAIYGAVKAIDHFTVSAEEARQKNRNYN